MSYQDLIKHTLAHPPKQRGMSVQSLPMESRTQANRFNLDIHLIK
jgi:hypothetical protein